MKEKIIKTKVGQLFVSYQPAEKIAVFLSGAGSLPTYENFLPVIRKLPKNWGYLTIDYPNAGQSPLENQENFVLDDLVQSILEVLSQFKVIQYAICAHSISGLVAVKIAESEPFCQGLILIEPTTYSVLYGELAQNPYPRISAIASRISCTVADLLWSLVSNSMYLPSASTVPPTGPSDPSTDVPMAGGKLLSASSVSITMMRVLDSRSSIIGRGDAEVMF